MGLIKKEYIDKLIDAVDIVDYIGQQNDLKKKGVNYFCNSPFSEDKTPSFCVNPVNQYFKDFSTGKAGNVITFIMEHSRLEFADAVKELAKFANLDVEYESDEFAQKHKEKLERLDEQRPVLKSAINQYRTALKNTEADHPARLELTKREYSDEELIDWEIGFAPGEKFIYDKCVATGKKEIAKQIGLISESHDKYWNRLIYPIRDSSGQLVGIAGRDLSGRKESAKWINPIESDLYQKNTLLYGLDKAKRQIASTRNAWIVEGYNDVIAWHRYGMNNTVAPCGTAITTQQINIIKKLADKVTLCFDSDKAGTKASLKHIPLLLAAGLSVEICRLPDCDPDDFVRLFKVELEEKGLPEILKDFVQDGFKFLMNENLQGSETDKTNGIKIISEVISKVQDTFLKDTYINWLAKESKFSKKLIQDAVDSASAKEKKVIKDNSIDWYMWPKSVAESDKPRLREMRDRYGIFMHNCKIYKDKELSAISISNFEIEIVQHMNDDKFPKKLVRIKNVKGKESVFDTPSENFNSLLSFKNAVTAYGNFKFKGNNTDLDMLTDYLFDEMGVGRKIDILGWQSDANCWVWNNGVTIPGVGTKDMDENGVFEHQDTTYYVPSANTIYKNSAWQYQSQKKFILKGGDVSFTQYISLMKDVHRNHAISASLFALASIFQDIIADKFHFFPILFLYGPASSGKSQLAIACQSLFGMPQPQINLGQSLTTGKAMIREFAQMNNSIGILNEYKAGLPGIDDMIKGLWDRQGYKRGTLDSKVASEEVPILSSVLMTGNYYPNNEIVISRIIAEEMVKDSFSSADKKKFEDLEDILKHGVSRVTQEVLHQRSRFESEFSKEFRLAKEHISSFKSLEGLPERYFQNVAVLGATYSILSEQFSFPFTKLEMFNHFEHSLLLQRKKVEYSSTVSRFWDLFLVGIRGAETLKLRAHVDYKMVGSHLYFNFTNVFNRIQTEWWQRFQEACPGKMALKGDLKDSASFIGSKSSEPMAPGRDAINTSVEMFDIKKLDNYEEVMYSIQVQMNSQQSLAFDGTNSPEGVPDELPF